LDRAIFEKGVAKGAAGAKNASQNRSENGLAGHHQLVPKGVPDKGKTGSWGGRRGNKKRKRQQEKCLGKKSHKQ